MKTLIKFDSWAFRIIFFSAIFILLIAGMSLKVGATSKSEFKHRKEVCKKEQTRIQSKHQTHKVWKPRKSSRLFK